MCNRWRKQKEIERRVVDGGSEGGKEGMAMCPFQRTRRSMVEHAVHFRRFSGHFPVTSGSAYGADEPGAPAGI